MVDVCVDICSVEKIGCVVAAIAVVSLAALSTLVPPEQ